MANSGVESQLLTEPISHLDLSDYCIVTADSTVRNTVERMQATHTNCAFVVGKGTRLVGILTDRDVLQRVATQPPTWDQPIESVMTKTPDTLPPTATTGEALRQMEARRYRNIPVVNQHGVIQGNVTYFGILNYLTAHFPQAVYNLPPEPDNFAEQRDGG